MTTTTHTPSPSRFTSPDFPQADPHPLAPPPPLPPESTGLESALSLAFPPIDAPQDALTQLADSPAAPELLVVAPRPTLISLEELIRVITNHPIIIIRKIGIPVATLIAISAALFFHILLIGGFLLALYFNILHLHPGSSNNSLYSDGGGSGDGYMIFDNGPQGPPTLNGSIDDLLAHAPSIPSPIPTSQLPVNSSPANLASEQLAAAPLEPDLIGNPSAFALPGQPRPRFDLPHVPQPTPNSVVVTPPSANPAKSSPNQTLAVAGRTGPAAASPGYGIDDGGSVDEGPVVDILKPGADGFGHGHGNKSGNGSGSTDRGESGANNPSPQVLQWGTMTLPDSILQNLPPHNCIYRVTILADGTPDKNSVELVQSCGNTAIDELWKSAVLHTKFRPAYAAGKPFATSDTYTYKFNLDEK